MEMNNVKINVENLEELLNSENETEIIDVMRPALIQVRDSEGHYDVIKEIEKLKIDDPVKILKMEKEAPEKEEKLKKGLLNGDKFNMFRPTCFGKISYSHLTRVLKNYGYNVSQKGNCIADKKMANIPFERLQELEEIEKNYNGSKKSTQEILAMSFVTKDFSDQKMMSIRTSSKEQVRLETLAMAYPMFTKQYLLSLVLSLGMDFLGFFPEERNEKNSNL